MSVPLGGGPVGSRATSTDASSEKKPVPDVAVRAEFLRRLRDEGRLVDNSQAYGEFLKETGRTYDDWDFHEARWFQAEAAPETKAKEEREAKIVRDTCLKALRGEAAPTSEVFSIVKYKPKSKISIRRCTVRGLRHHLNFALSSEVEALFAEDAAYARARNARLIMSNIIPDMENNDHKPYCIWYPDFATKKIYRELARRYPDMRYHVGRACAAAGYDDLYQELEPQLLPDISIAEEARDTVKEGRARKTDEGEIVDAVAAERARGAARIFDSIISQKTRFSVMDDYQRAVNLNSPRSGVYLNGDTALRSSLKVRQSFEDDWGWVNHYFDITEDCGIAEDAHGSFHIPLTDEEVPLLYNPLPLDLPTSNKDALTITAAYEGNVDRYARLRRPIGIWAPYELQAVIRGIYHHTTFAKWWEKQEPALFPRDVHWLREHIHISEAITARFIMNNDLSRIEKNDPKRWPKREVPLLISWPHIPEYDTIDRLLELKPTEARLPAAIAVIRGNNPVTFEEMKLDPHPLLWRAAQNSPNPIFCEYFEARAKELGVKVDAEYEKCPWRWDNWGESWHDDMEETISFGEGGEICVGGILAGPSYEKTGIYPGADQTTLTCWENYISAFKEPGKQ